METHECDPLDPFNYPSSRGTVLQDAGYNPFEDIRMAPPDPLFGLTEIKKQISEAHPDARICDLGLGTVRKDGPWTPQVYIDAERQIVEAKSTSSNPEYSGQAGKKEYVDGVVKMIFGSGHPLLKEGRDRVVGLAIPGGTAGSYMMSEICNIMKSDLEQGTEVRVFLGEPTWPNHPKIFRRGGNIVTPYDYLDKEKPRTNINNLGQVLEDQRKESQDHGQKLIPVIVIQDGCHNPTGISYSESDQKELIRLAKKHKAVIFNDIAYHGLGKGLEEDTQLTRLLVEAGIPMVIAYSLSKNFQAYDKRAGACIAVMPDAVTATRLKTRMTNDIARPTWNCPPSDPQDVVSKILGDPYLRSQWVEELANTRALLQERRHVLAETMDPKLYGTLQHGQGLFALLNMTPEQVRSLRRPMVDESTGLEVAAVAPDSGRINLGGAEISGMDLKDAMQLLGRRLNEVLKIKREIW